MHSEAEPVMVGTGKEFTVTLLTVGDAAEHEPPLV